MKFFCKNKKAPTEGIEPSTYGLEVHRAIHCAMRAYTLWRVSCKWLNILPEKKFNWLSKATWINKFKNIFFYSQRLLDYFSIIKNDSGIICKLQSVRRQYFVAFGKFLGKFIRNARICSRKQSPQGSFWYEKK